MDQMVRNDIACNCIPIVRIAFRYAHISFYSLFLKFSALGLLQDIRRPKAENLRKSEYNSLTLLLLFPLELLY